MSLISLSGVQRSGWLEVVSGRNLRSGSDIFSVKGQPLRALDGVSLPIFGGEVIGILGESGCGKSTLASALMQTLPPHASCTGGSISLRGQNLLNLPRRYCARSEDEKFP